MNKRNYDEDELILAETDGKKRFELHVDGHVAFAEYMVVRTTIMYVTHTEVPKALEGKGAASALIGKVLSYIKEHNYKLAPLCPFLASYLNKHPEKAEGILAPGFRIGK